MYISYIYMCVYVCIVDIPPNNEGVFKEFSSFAFCCINMLQQHFLFFIKNAICEILSDFACFDMH